MNIDVLTRLQQALPNLRPAEQRLARAVLASPEIVHDSTITQLATACGTSPTTVVRFATALGFSGYPEFRMALSATVGHDRAQQARFDVDQTDVDPNDSLEQVVAKVAYQETNAIEQTAHMLDLDALDRAVAAIDGSDRCDVFGVASSGLVAQDLQQKLHRIGMISHVWLDPHLALTSAALLTSQSVLVVFSHSGLTIEAEHVLATAKDSGALTITVTNVPDSPLGRASDLTLTTAARETRFRSGAMASRTAQLALIDILFIRIAQRRFDALGHVLARTHDAVQQHRMGPQ